MTEARVRSVGPEIDKRAGENIRRFREALGWSFHELSFQIRSRTGEDITIRVLRDMEDPENDRRITLGEASALAGTFGVTIDVLSGRAA